MTECLGWDFVMSTSATSDPPWEETKALVESLERVTQTGRWPMWVVYTLLVARSMTETASASWSATTRRLLSFVTARPAG